MFLKVNRKLDPVKISPETLGKSQDYSLNHLYGEIGRERVVVEDNEDADQHQHGPPVALKPNAPGLVFWSEGDGEHPIFLWLKIKIGNGLRQLQPFEHCKNHFVSRMLPGLSQ